MQYLNDDMDELFRRAAKEYPLNTSGANWEKVKSALEKAPAAESIPNDRNYKRHLLWLLLVLPFGLICNRVEQGQKEWGRNEEGLHTLKTGTGRAAAGLVPEVEDVLNRAAGIPPVKKETKVAFLSTPDPEKGRRGIMGSSSEETGYETVEVGLLRENKAQLRPFADGQNMQQNITPAQVNRASEMNDNRLNENELVSESPEKEVVTKPQAAARASLPQTGKGRNKRFYAGIIGGLDITTVKLQKVKGIGYDIGLLAGYEINRKWSVEAGLLSSEKAYYTKGQYLGKAQAYMPYGSKIVDAEGDCRMLELPLAIRYRVAEGKKGSWVASAGVSSYFMKREDYNYTVWNQNTGQEEQRNRYYTSNSNYLAAAVQLSAAYQYNLGKNISLRFEPFVKVPVGKVGYYELPLTSAGVHIGITRKLF